MRLSSSLLLAFLALVPFAASAQVTPTIIQRDCGISSLSGSSQTIAVANPNRKNLVIYNTGSSSIYVNSAGGTAANTGVSSIIVSTGNGLVWKEPDGVPRNAITVVGTSGQPVACFEGN